MGLLAVLLSAPHPHPVLPPEGEGTHFSRRHRLFGAVLLCLATAAGAGTPNVISTRHNLSFGSSATIKSSPESAVTEVCVFCHTPHSPRNAVDRALWNRSLSTATYTRYNSSSLDANFIADVGDGMPAGASKLCLSCHDGTLAIGSITNSPKSGSGSEITMLNVAANGTMPDGKSGYPNSGFTRKLGSDLTNDHPISITYNDELAARDGELQRMDGNQKDIRTGGTIVGIPSPGFRPTLPLSRTSSSSQGQVQCTTCHDPHQSDPSPPNKFLRLPRMQEANPPQATFNASNQICLSCHEKLGAAWTESAHAKPLVADEAYLNAAASLRQFPTGTKVWQAGCLNCHDTHTVQGSRRLLREGVTGAAAGSGAGTYRQGAASGTTLNTVSSIENTCYQCHDAEASTTRIIGTVTGPASTVPDIKSEFAKAVHMPITSDEQAGSPKREAHDITNSDFIETPETLGRNNPLNRHVECTDCHNPHRARRRSTFYGLSSTVGDGALRTHRTGGTELKQGADGNIASGPLRGTWGVEPTFGPMTASWPQRPLFYTVKKGDPANSSTARSEAHLTREYQLCLKCHSDYSNSDDPTQFPALGNNSGGTANGTNSVSRFTNVAAEFGSVVATDPPTSGTDQGESGGDPFFTPNGSPPADAGDANKVNNHRSWHPVMWPTGRTRSERTNTGTFGNIRAPFDTDGNIGFQTMYCSDCHASEISWTQGSGPDRTKTQGPHGSANRFLLNGTWDAGYGPTPYSASGDNSSGSNCGRCHNPTGGAGGFSSSSAAHGGQNKGQYACTACHIAVPHGWKNKAFLVNLNCIGAEVQGFAAGCTAEPSGIYSRPSYPPYYIRSLLRINVWRRSTDWEDANNCGNFAPWMNGVCGTGTAP